MPIVAIVGLDGCGKTTQARMLVENLNREGHDAVYVEPLFFLIRALTRPEHEDFLLKASPRRARTASVVHNRGNSVSLTDVLKGFIFYLYAYATYLLIARQSSKRFVVCDRYFFQFFFDSFGEHADSIIEAFPKPDMTLYLDSQIDTLYQRMDDPSDISTSRDYFMKAEEMFEALSRRYCFTRVDASQSVDHINKELLRMVVGGSNEK